MLPASPSSTSLQQEVVISCEHRTILLFSFSMAIISLNHSGRALGGNSFILGNRLFRLWRALPSRFHSSPQIIRPSNVRRLATCDRAPRSQVSQNAIVRRIIFLLFFEQSRSQELLSPHHMEDEHLLFLDSVEDATRWDDQLPVWHARQFRWDRAHAREFL